LLGDDRYLTAFLFFLLRPVSQHIDIPADLWQCDKPLEDAFRIANVEMINWVAELLEISTMDAYQLVSQTSLSPAGNVVDTVYTMICKIPKKLLGEAALKAFGGAHESLRARAQEWANR